MHTLKTTTTVFSGAMVDALGVGQQEQKPHRTVGIVAEGLNYSQAVFVQRYCSILFSICPISDIF